MNSTELALKYMAAFYGDSPLESMKPLLASDLVFEGPFHTSKTGDAYFESLAKNPPKDVKYQILEVYEKETSACLIYQFSKPGVETTMVQTFEINDGKITKIKLIFDTRAFT